MNINDASNKNRIAIVVVGYNRLKSIKRLIDSLLVAQYPSTGVPLYISIDASGDEKLYEYVKSVEWPYGEKYINIQEKRLGLKAHIYQCGELTRYFKAIILLEDDLVVSSYFFNYVVRSVEEYGEEDIIAEISLYKNELNGYVSLPFRNLQDGSDVFLMKDISTWGQCWTEQMWRNFVKWRDSHSEDDILKVDMPERIKNWERAWSKYYLAYVIDTRRYALFPNISLTTNFSDAGEHGCTQNSAVQVSLLQGDKQYVFNDVSKLARYDIYYTNEAIYEWLGMNEEDVCLDLYGNHSCSNKRYLLSTRLFSYHIVDSYALYMRPIELNIKYKLKGEGIYLYDTTDGSKNDKGFSKFFTPYMLGTFTPGLLKRFVLDCYWDAIKLKFQRLFK